MMKMTLWLQKMILKYNIAPQKLLLAYIILAAIMLLCFGLVMQKMGVSIDIILCLIAVIAAGAGVIYYQEFKRIKSKKEELEIVEKLREILLKYNITKQKLLFASMFFVAILLLLFIYVLWKADALVEAIFSTITISTTLIAMIYYQEFQRLKGAKAGKFMWLKFAVIMILVITFTYTVSTTIAIHRQGLDTWILM